MDVFNIFSSAIIQFILFSLSSLYWRNCHFLQLRKQVLSQATVFFSDLFATRTSFLILTKKRREFYTLEPWIFHDALACSTDCAIATWEAMFLFKIWSEWNIIASFVYKCRRINWVSVHLLSVVVRVIFGHHVWVGLCLWAIEPARVMREIPHFGIGIVWGAIPMSFPVFWISVSGCSLNSYGTSPNLWVQKKLIKFRQSTQDTWLRFAKFLREFLG